ncbi:hypothetical protein M3Y99_01962000 [Aphelenchoides fujianensis]|nr:hypothetical protein M3Y99_01962000 [Aphelenchoides fujianensis]
MASISAHFSRADHRRRRRCSPLRGPVWLYRVLDFPSNAKPWYRGRYDVVRPDSEVAMQRRPPKDYPANYLSNRRTDSYRKYLKDYGWKANLGLGDPCVQTRLLCGVP